MVRHFCFNNLDDGGDDGDDAGPGTYSDGDGDDNTNGYDDNDDGGNVMAIAS